MAYHEVGHAMVAYKQKNAEPVQKITIVPHTQGSLGYTLLMPEEDKTNLRTKDELLAKIAVSMGGRAAEEVVLNTMTNGAAQDIQEATNIARNMVAMFGMSEEFGMMALGSVPQPVSGRRLRHGLRPGHRRRRWTRRSRTILDAVLSGGGAGHPGEPGGYGQGGGLSAGEGDHHRRRRWWPSSRAGTPPWWRTPTPPPGSRKRPSAPLSPTSIEAPAKHIHIVSEEIKPPKPDVGGEEPEPGSGDRPKRTSRSSPSPGMRPRGPETQDGPGPGQGRSVRIRKRQTAGETFVSPAVFRPARRLERDQGEAVIFLGKVGVGIAPERLNAGHFEEYSGVFLLLDDEDDYRSPVTCCRRPPVCPSAFGAATPRPRSSTAA